MLRLGSGGASDASTGPSVASWCSSALIAIGPTPTAWAADLRMHTSCLTPHGSAPTDRPGYLRYFRAFGLFQPEVTVSSPSRPSPAGRAWVGEKRSGRPALRLAGRRPAPAR